MKQTFVAFVCSLVLASCQAQEPAKVGPVELKETSVADLDKAIAGHKGKVVLIDIWFLG